MEEIIPPIMENAIIKLFNHFKRGLPDRTPSATAMTRPVTITAACIVSPIKRTGIYTANRHNINVPLNTYFQLLVPSVLLTLMQSFLPSGRRIVKPLNIPILIRIITTPKSAPDAFSNISAFVEKPMADATELEINDS